jgi:hypothetical protein
MFTAVSGVTYACNGSNGEQGQDGDDGASVTNQALAPGDDPACPNGGTKFTSADGVSYACNGSNGQDGQDGVDGQDGRDGVDGQDGEDFSGTFTSPNGQFKLAISDSGVLLEKLQQPGQQLRHMIRLTDTSIQIETPGLFSAVTGGTAIGGRTQITLNSGSALATLNGGNGRITLNGSNCGVLRPADFASDIGPGGGQILLNPLNAGSPTVRFGC